MYATGKGREEMRKLWNDVNECLIKNGRGGIVLSADMNGRVQHIEVVWSSGEKEEYCESKEERKASCKMEGLGKEVVHA